MFPQVPNTQIRLDLSWRPVALSFFHIFVIFSTSEKYFQNIQRIFSKYFQPLQNIHICAIGPSIFIWWMICFVSWIFVFLSWVSRFSRFAYNCLVDQSLVVKSHDHEILSFSEWNLMTMSFVLIIRHFQHLQNSLWICSTQ